jgi:hypothetical protein
MEPLDDFESLLKGAAENYNKELLTEQSVSKMIDNRLTESKKKLMSAFRKEITLIIVCFLFMIFFLGLSISFKSNHSGKATMAFNSIYLVGMFYLLACLFLFIRLIRVSLLQKGTDIRDYVTRIYKKTQSALQMYLWMSNIATLAMIAIPLAVSGKISWYWILSVSILFGTAIHYANIWYIRKRFGKKLDEMKALITEFN